MIDGEILDLSDEDEPEYSVTLPVTQDKFADFLGSIIGGADKLNYAFSGNICVNADTLRGLELTLKERVEKQNHGKLLSTRYSISFSDGKGFRSNDLEKILSISPMQKSITRFVSIQYIFLVTYPDIEHPCREKVTISIGPIADSVSYRRSRFDGSEPARVEIEYINRSWAEDILNVIQRIFDVDPEISQAGAKLQKNRMFSREFAVVSVPFLSVLVFLGVSYWIIDDAAIITKFDDGTPKLDQVISHLESLSAKYQPHLTVLRGLMFIALGIIVAIFSAMAAEISWRPDTPSSLIFELYESDLKYHQRIAEIRERRKRKALMSFALSIVGGIVAAALYEYLVSFG